MRSHNDSPAMRVLVESIPRTGRTIALRLDADWTRAAAAAALDLEPGALTGSLELSPPQRGVVTVQASVRLEAATTCHRCGEAFQLELSTDPELRYAPVARQAAGNDEVELQEEELDLGWYEDDELDLGAILQEAIALALPARYTCPDTEACDARTRALLEASRPEQGGHPGFSVLKDLTQ